MNIPQPSYKNKQLFAIGLIILQVIVVLVYAFVLRVEPHSDDDSIGYSFPSYMDLIIFVTLGIGFLNTFIRTYMYTGMIHNWLYYTISIQIFFIFQAMWKRAFGKQLFGRNTPGNGNWTIQLRQQDYTLAAYSTSVMNMVFGICFGRIGYFQKLIIVVFQMIAYTLNAIVLNDVFKVYDVGGSIFCHIFGCYFGMGISLIISRYRRPVTKIQHSYESIVFSYLGCFFIFAYAPSMNSQYLTQTPFQKSIVIMNTILSMCCSVMASFATSIFIKKKFSVIDLFNGSLCGCIGAGSSTGLFVNPCACMILGALSGITCVLGMEYLTGYLERKFTLFDTFGIHNVRGLPGIIGGFGGAIAIALSYTVPQDALGQLKFLNSHQGRTIGDMVGYQILGTVSSVLFSFICGCFTGYVITLFYNIDPVDFYKDSIYFQLPQTALKQFKKKGAHIKKKQSFMDKNFLQYKGLSNTNDSGYEIGEESQQNSSSTILQTQSFGSKLRKKSTLPPLQKKLTFQQKIDLTVQNLKHAPVNQQQVQHSEQAQQYYKTPKQPHIMQQKQESQQDNFQKQMRLQRQELQNKEKRQIEQTNIDFQKTRQRVIQIRSNLKESQESIMNRQLIEHNQKINQSEI